MVYQAVDALVDCDVHAVWRCAVPLVLRLVELAMFGLRGFGPVIAGGCTSSACAA